ncbi:MAG TPA: hypothetical protein VJ600_04700 [Holophagaceae bacterium]|nr:hypothetical protein [Holophagaceae bacterium]
MRPILLALLAPALLAQGSAPSLPEPGASPSLQAELRAALAAAPRDLFIRELHQPMPEASVEIVETLTPEEVKFRAFEAFKVLMLRSLAEYLGRYSDTRPGTLLASRPASGSPEPRVYPMGKALGF